MMPIPQNEAERLSALYYYELLDTGFEQAFQDLARLAAQACQVPMAVIALTDHDRHWFKAKFGVEGEQMPRENTFCAHTILGSEILQVPDAHCDARFAQSPLVTEPRISASMPARLWLIRTAMCLVLCAFWIVSRVF